MSDKDFLSQFSGDKKIPESFKQEERKPIIKEKKPVNKGLLITAIALLLVVGVVGYFVFLAPKIEMPNFVGETKKDVAAWVKQQGIEASGVIFEDDYYFDYGEGVIVSQSVEAGKKVKENVKLNFVSSLGPDPDEKIKTPDLINMTKQEIQDWVSKNKLTKVKINNVYSDEVEEGNVISFEYSGCDADSFTRSSTLKVNVSKGEEPAATVTLEDFTKKTYEYVENFAKTKKISLTKTEAYSDTIDKGLIISQSVASGKTMKENETLNVVVSKGKAIYMPNMYEWTETQIQRWCSNNGLGSSFTYEYDDEGKGECIYQSAEKDSILTAGQYVDFVISLGDPALESYVGSYIESLEAWVNVQNEQKANLKIARTYDFSDEYEKGKIISMDTRVKTGGTINVKISRGKNIFIQQTYTAGTWPVDLTAAQALTEDEIKALCNEAGFTYSFKYVEGSEVNKVVDFYYYDDNNVKRFPTYNQYLAQDVTIYIEICDHTS